MASLPHDLGFQFYDLFRKFGAVGGRSGGKFLFEAPKLGQFGLHIHSIVIGETLMLFAFDNVTFGYNGEPVIEDVSFELHGWSPSAP